MRITHHDSKPLIATLHRDVLRVFDVSSGTAVEVASATLPDAQLLASCGAFVAALAGRVGPAGASIAKSEMVKLSWELEPMGDCVLGEVARHDLSLTADGSRVVTTDWKRCQVTVFDTTDGARVCANGAGIPSGASFAPRGERVIAGSADQGSGDILLFDVAGAAAGKMPMRSLPEPAPCPGLDDAPYFSVWSRSGDLAALSNESWGGRGVFVYDMLRERPAWSVEFAGASEESEDWFAYPLAFASGDRVLLAGGPGSLHAYSTDDGRALGEIKLAGTGRDGFVVDEPRWLLWTPGPAPTSCALPPEWRDARPMEGFVAKPKKPKARGRGA